MNKFYHNPRCRKSREALALLTEKGEEIQIVEYLKEVPTERELAVILKKLGIKAQDLLRKGEAIFKENYKGKELSEKDWIKAMCENPKLIERPIFIVGQKAIVGRPPENVLQLIS
ncbi:UNVERIFIED_CONTAM: hypothetical protein GTU68_022290 [Idotea baltica]|nr:hypothetical protein [Idotea baltica]